MNENRYTIELKNISIAKNNQLILDDISFVVPMGMTTVIVGPLGSGKSTLLKTLASIYLPDAGKLVVNGKQYNLMSDQELKQFRRDTGFVFQDSALWSNKSLYQNLELPLQYHFPKMSADEINKKIRKTLALLGYEGPLDRRPSDISAGNRKLISFARALVTDPDIIMVDGPETSLDFSSQGKIRSFIREQKAAGKTLLICTYDEYITSMLSDYLVILFKNRIYAHGAYNEIVKSSDPVIRQILSHVLDKVSNFDTDILDLINPDIS